MKFLKINRIYLIIGLGITLSIFFMYLNDNYIFQSLITYLFDKKEFINNQKLSDNPFMGKNVFEYLSFILSRPELKHFDYNIIFGPNLLQLFPPVFASISAYLFYQFYHNFLHYKLYRQDRYFKTIIKQIGSNANKMALSIFISFLIFYIFLFFFSNGSNAISYVEKDSTGVIIIPKSLLLDLFTDQFYLKHIYLYYLLEGFIKFYLITFSYCFLAQSLVVFFYNLKLIIMIPILYFYGLTMLCLALNDFCPPLFIHLNLMTIMANGDYPYLNSIILILLACLPIMMSIIIVFQRSHHVEI
ncbi:MAG: hypothetical protein LBT75_04875 [Bacilli bacterium]|jgi:hypothetical protein|nr:hypothetical protein [Bacilli bacterium]